MGSDRARVTYDPSRQWRAVVAQQGRVSLEADFNEQVAIADARDRLMTLDAVGPVASPDSGYQVVPVSAANPPAGATAGDLTVTPGTLYLGGQRLELGSTLTYSAQPEWLNASTDPLYVPPLAAATTASTGTGAPTSLAVDALTQPLAAGTTFAIAGDTNSPSIVFTLTTAGAVGDTSLAVTASPAITTAIAPGALLPAGAELVYLLAAAQEVAAVEDPALADVALGGPDTTQRVRILQRIVRAPTLSATCTDAWSALQSTSWAAQGYQLDAASSELRSTAGLLVSFANAPAAPTPCQPVATGGYLGAANQLIRVAVASVTDGVPMIVWGYDDASFMYRLSAASYDSASDTTTVTLASAPVDSAHYPAGGQVVELLRDAVQLAAEDYIAAPSGLLAAVPSGDSYDPTQGTLAVGGQPPADYLQNTAQLYLRVWQAELAATPGAAVALGDTGLAVTLSSSDGAFHPGDFWTFAVRPIEPTIVYPARYLNTAQPPEGPRTWSCPLALVTWSDGTPSPTSCVPSFSNLVSLSENVGGCCTVSVRPSDVDQGATLGQLVDSYASQGPVTICLEPGTYTLPGPLVLGPAHDGITLQACREGVVLCASDTPAGELLLGLVVIQGATGVTLDGLEVQIPLVGFTPPADAFSGLSSDNATLLDAFANGLEVAIGVSVQTATDLAITGCRFTFPDLGQANVFGAGIYASGVIDGLTLTGSSFSATDPPTTVPFADLANPQLEGYSPQPPYQLTVGVLDLPTGEATPSPTPTPTAVSLGGRGPIFTGGRPILEHPILEQSLAGEASGASGEQVGAVPFTLPVTFHPTILPTFHPTLEPTFIPTIQPTFPVTFIPFTPIPTFTAPPVTLTPVPTPPPTAAPTPPPVITDPGSLPVPVLHDARIDACRFEGLSLPVLGLAQLGTIWLGRNTVRNCYGGFWLVSFDDSGAITLFDQLGSGVTGLWSDFSNTAITALLDRIFMIAFSMGQILPTTPPVADTVPLRVINLPDPFQINRVQSLLGNLAGILKLISPIAAPTATSSPTPASARLAPTDDFEEVPHPELSVAPDRDPEFELPGLGFEPVRPIIPSSLPGILQLTKNLTAQQAAGTPAVTAPPADTGTQVQLRLEIADSEIDAVIADSWSGAGIVVLDFSSDPGTTILHGNRVRNRFPQGQTAVLVQVADAAITGNVIANEVSGTIATGTESSAGTPTTSSLVVQPTTYASTATVAVTGNVLVGQGSPLTLPARPLAAPLDSWDGLNAVTTYTPPPTPTPTATPAPTATPPPPTPTPTIAPG